MADTKRVVITGATGLIGKRLCEQLKAKGYQIVVFSRDPQQARRSLPGAAEYITWTPAEEGPWTGAIDGAYGVIHLAGAPIIGKRWSAAYKAEIRNSRVIGTRGLVNAMRAAQHRPQVFVSGSAVGYYGARDDTKLDESAAPGDDFLARTCIEWEREAAKAEELGIRTAIVRTGIVLDPREGALPQMLLPFRFYAGGPILPGTQWFPWIHVDDEIGLIMLALEDQRVRGPLNAAAPESQTNRDFSATLGRVMRSPSWFPVPGFALRIVLGEVSGMLAEGQRVIPKKALDLGYQFKYPNSEQALRQLLRKGA
ncbi:MAG TPA: TIGR01777 family oxidoreductase [Herpetosiphonaceae bacterium]